jgi:hypothetical protein
VRLNSDLGLWLSEPSGSFDERETYMASKLIFFTALVCACLGNFAAIGAQDDRRNYIYHDNDEFSRTWQKCGTDAWGNADETTQCVSKAYPGLSAPCANCLGAFSGCIRSECWWSCIMGSEDDCKDCGNEYCRPGLVTCTGVPEADHPGRSL